MGSTEHKFLKGSGVKRTGFRGQNKRFRGGKNMLRGQENKEGVKKICSGVKKICCPFPAHPSLNGGHLGAEADLMRDQNKV